MKGDEANHMVNQTDQGILDLLQSRDENAMEKIQNQYGSYIYAIAYRVVKSQEDAEECVNDCLLKLWETIPPLIPRSLKAYIGTVTRNLSLDCYRKQHTQGRNKDFTEILDECTLYGLENPELLVENQIITESIQKFLKKTSQDRRFLFVGRYYYGYSTSELAKKSGLSEVNVRKILSRIRKDLKKQLVKDGVYDG